jgi:hypothetical protein
MERSFAEEVKVEMVELLAGPAMDHPVKEV